MQNILKPDTTSNLLNKTCFWKMIRVYFAQAIRFGFHRGRFVVGRKKREPTSVYQIQIAMLNFVGGKNIIVPAERSSPAKAKDMCKGQGMELMDLKSVTEMDSVKDFLGDIGNCEI
jgi:hypothetical protein